MNPESTHIQQHGLPNRIITPRLPPPDHQNLILLQSDSVGVKVAVTENRDAVKGCRFLGRVKDSGGWSSTRGRGMWGDMGESEAEKGMRNDTADVGGNVLLLTDVTRGEAYLCDQAHVEALLPGSAGPDATAEPPREKEKE